MDRKSLNNIMMIHSDPDHVRVWDYIGQMLLKTITEDTNCCCETLLPTTEDIESFVYSFLPIAVEFALFPGEKLDKEEVQIIAEELARLIKFEYNFNKNNSNYQFGGSECQIIDLIECKSYIH